jgi:hypothetical protein
MNLWRLNTALKENWNLSTSEIFISRDPRQTPKAWWKQPYLSCNLQSQPKQQFHLLRRRYRDDNQKYKCADLWFLRLLSGQGNCWGHITSGYRQDQEAGKLATNILAGQKAENLKVITNSPNQYMFDYKYIRQHNIGKSSLPNGSQMINTPPAPYERY